MYRKKVLRKRLIILLLMIIIIIGVYEIVRTFSRYTSSADIEDSVDLGFWIVEEGYSESTLFLDELYPRENYYYTYPFTISNYDGQKTTEVDMEYTINLIATTNMPLNYFVYQRIENTTGLSNLQISEEVVYAERINNDNVISYEIVDVNDVENEDINDTVFIYRKLPIELYEEGNTIGNYYAYIQNSDLVYYRNSIYSYGFDNESKLIIEHDNNHNGTTENFLILVEFPISYTDTYTDPETEEDSENTIEYRTITEYQDLIEYVKLGIEAKQRVEEE